MNSNSIYRFSAGVLFLLGILPVFADHLSRDQAPGKNFDLSHWKLTLPLDKDGHLAGKGGSTAAEIQSTELVSGFSDEYFKTGPDSAMVFWCPVTGATTTSSIFPRSELREMQDPTHPNVNWTSHGTHILEARCQINQLPPGKSKVIIGQVHGFGDEANPLIKLTYFLNSPDSKTGSILGVVDDTPTGKAQTVHLPLLENVPLNTSITYRIKVTDGTLEVSASTGDQTAAKSYPFAANFPAWKTMPLYFKAGDYCQSNVGSDVDGSKVSFYSLNVSHSPAILTP